MDAGQRERRGDRRAEQTTQTTQEPKRNAFKPIAIAGSAKSQLKPFAEQPPQGYLAKPEPGQSQARTRTEQEQPAEVPAAAEAEEQHVPEDWPVTAKARVAEEARKRRERTIERDQWKEEAAKLFLQLNELNSLKLRPTKALTEVVDRQSLTAAENHWKEIRRFARTNPDGADDVFLGKDANGNDIRGFPGKIIQMGLDADEGARGTPVEEFVASGSANQRRPKLLRSGRQPKQAGSSGHRATGTWILQEPDWAFVMAITAGRKMRRRKRQGRAEAQPGAQAILGAPKMAPVLLKTRRVADL